MIWTVHKLYGMILQSWTESKIVDSANQLSLGHIELESKAQAMILKKVYTIYKSKCLIKFHYTSVLTLFSPPFSSKKFHSSECRLHWIPWVPNQALGLPQHENLPFRPIRWLHRCPISFGVVLVPSSPRWIRWQFFRNGPTWMFTTNQLEMLERLVIFVQTHAH